MSLDQENDNDKMDEDYFRQHPQLWNEPRKIIEDRKIDSLDKITILKKDGLLNLLSCFNLETLIKFLQINRSVNKIVQQSPLLKKFLEVKFEYVNKKTLVLNYGKYTVSQLLKNNCEIYSKFQKKYRVSKNDSIIIFGELLKKQILREFKKSNDSNSSQNIFNLRDFKLKEFGLSLLNYAISDIDLFTKISLCGNTEAINNFAFIKCFVNYSKSKLLYADFSNNNFSDLIGANLFACFGMNCPNIMIINVSNNAFTHSIFQNQKIKEAFKSGFKKLRKLIINNNLLGTRGLVELLSNLRECKKLNLLDVSYNGIDKNVFNNKIVVNFFNEDMPSLYSFYYDGNYLPTEEVQNLAKAFLNCSIVTYLNLQNNQINDDSMEIISFLIEHNSYLHSLFLGYNKFTSKGIKVLCKGLQSEDTRLIELSLSNNHLDETSLIYLSEALPNNKTLSCLNLSYNNFSKGDTGTLISKIINESQRLKNLNLTACHLGLKMKTILETVETNKKLTYLDLSVNDIGSNDDIFRALAKTIANNFYLKYLYLDTNHICDKDFDTIINEGIIKNKNLSYLSLKTNKITLSSIKAVSDSLKKDNKKQLEYFMKEIKKAKTEGNIFSNTKGYLKSLLSRDLDYLKSIDNELNTKGILNSVQTNNHIKIIIMDGNPTDQESLIKLNTVLKFNGEIKS